MGTSTTIYGSNYIKSSKKRTTKEKIEDKRLKDAASKLAKEKLKEKNSTLINEEVIKGIRWKLYSRQLGALESDKIKQKIRT